MPPWGSVGLPLLEPAARCADPSALDVELVLVLYEVLVERADCGVCGAPLNPAVNVEFTRQILHRRPDRRGHALPWIEAAPPRGTEWSNETVSFGSADLRRATGSVLSGHREALT